MIVVIVTVSTAYATPVEWETHSLLHFSCDEQCAATGKGYSNNHDGCDDADGDLMCGGVSGVNSIGRNPLDMR